MQQNGKSAHSRPLDPINIKGVKPHRVSEIPNLDQRSSHQTQTSCSKSLAPVTTSAPRGMKQDRDSMV